MTRKLLSRNAISRLILKSSSHRHREVTTSPDVRAAPGVRPFSKIPAMTLKLPLHECLLCARRCAKGSARYRWDPAQGKHSTEVVQSRPCSLFSVLKSLASDDGTFVQRNPTHPPLGVAVKPEDVMRWRSGHWGGPSALSTPGSGRRPLTGDGTHTSLRPHPPSYPGSSSVQRGDYFHPPASPGAGSASGQSL